MSLKIAVQMDPIERINIKGDSTFALLLEAQKRGHQLSYYTPDRLALLNGQVFALEPEHRFAASSVERLHHDVAVFSPKRLDLGKIARNQGRGH